ncbi:MAG: THxN family PEP-CTERM protein [Chlamydiia bacterium]|nr:THxN family PEP-CTERM protein [Chlamydiia bacterium]
MKLNLKSLLWALCLAFVASTSSTQAIVVEVDNVDGVWTSVDPVGSATGIGTNEIRWGTPASYSGKSGYNFNGVTPPTVVTSDSTPFLLGTFTHINYPITGTSITQAELSVDFDLTIDGIVFNNTTFTYTFLHNETPNNGPNPDDIVTFVNPSPGQMVIANGQGYVVEILGFEVGGNIVSQFYTKENKMNSANLIAQVRQVGIPEPTTYLTLGSFLAFAAYVKRRKARRSAA